MRFNQALAAGAMARCGGSSTPHDSASRGPLASRQPTFGAQGALNDLQGATLLGDGRGVNRSN